MENVAGKEGTINLVKRIVLSEIKNVEINWRSQAKKKRIIVEFTGQGDTVEAKIRFRKMINFRIRKPDRTENREHLPTPQKGSNSITKQEASKNSAEVTPKASPKEAPQIEGKSPKKKKKKAAITSVSIVQLNQEAKEMRRTVRCQLIEKEKKNLGSLLSKLESKHRVKITSSTSGKTWEIVVNNLQRGNSSSAFFSIIRYLDSASSRPAGVV